MPDARWDDPREYDDRDRGDGRPRVYGERDRDDHDPRDSLSHDLDLPRGEERELVVDRDRVYELNGDDSRTLAAVGTFRVVPEQDIDTDHDTLRHLRDEGLVATVDLGGEERGLTLTREGRDLLDSHTLERDGGSPRAFHAGVSRPREIDHDANLYATFCQEEVRLRDEHPELEIRRVILEQDLKREYQEFLQDHNRNRSDTDGRPDRTDEEIRDWTREHDLPYFDGQVHLVHDPERGPLVRRAFEELATGHYTKQEVIRTRNGRRTTQPEGPAAIATELRADDAKSDLRRTSREP